jgi:hypothetical protein
MSVRTGGWHADAALVDRYVAGAVDPATAASIEAHVVRCADCRAALASRAPQARLSVMWAEVTERLDDPRAGLVERALRRLGLQESDARLAASAPALRLAWLLALVAVLLFCAAASDSPRVGPNLFLLLAPALPTLGVALAYGPWVDPTYEIGQATPYSATRLLLLRTAVVLGVTVVVVGMTGLLLPGHDTAVLWLLPAAALVSTALALSAWTPPVWAAGLTGGIWLCGVGTYWRAQGSVDSVFGPSGQLLAVALCLVAWLAITGGRRVHAYDVRRFL